VIGIEVHISTHKDSVVAFKGLCRTAGWHERFEMIKMWYLGSTAEARDRVARFAGMQTCRTTRNSNEEWTIDVSAKTIDDKSCLWNDPLWPGRQIRR
jgi:hypothetical protein